MKRKSRKQRRSKAMARPKRRSQSARRRSASKARRKKVTARKGTRKRVLRRKVTARTRRKAKAAKPARATSRSKKTQANNRPRTTERPALDRTRRVLPEAERMDLDSAASRSMSGDRIMSAARSGHDELLHELNQHTESSPVLTAGDIDAKWQDAYAIGDEAPGGDNPTPGQDRVEAIGKALGIEYQDDQELQGGDELTERDRHRWELDPASSEDWPHDKK